MSRHRAPRPFEIDRENARWLGVCAGIANRLDIPIALVRVVFVLSVIAWPTLLIGYLLVYFVFSRSYNQEDEDSSFRGAKTAEHFRQLNFRRPIYRFPSRGRIAGVCAGIADYLEVKPFWVRIACLGSFFILGPFTFLAYIACWVAFEKAPGESQYGKRGRRARRAERRQIRRQGSAEAAAASTAYSQPHSEPESDSSPHPEVLNKKDCFKTMRQLELRLRAIEAYMTSKRFRLHCEINRI